MTKSKSKVAKQQTPESATLTYSLLAWYGIFPASLCACFTFKTLTSANLERADMINVVRHVSATMYAILAAMLATVFMLVIDTDNLAAITQHENVFRLFTWIILLVVVVMESLCAIGYILHLILTWVKKNGSPIFLFILFNMGTGALFAGLLFLFIGAIVIRSYFTTNDPALDDATSNVIFYCMVLVYPMLIVSLSGGSILLHTRERAVLEKKDK